MKLRNRVLLLSNACLLLVLLCISLGMRRPLLAQFAVLEQQLMSKQVAKVGDALHMHVEQLDAAAISEANWTELHTYLAERSGADPDFYANNYSGGFGKWRYDLLCMIDRQGELRHLDLVNTATQMLKPASGALRNQLLQLPNLQRFPADNDPALIESRNAFFLNSELGPLMVVSRPVLTSNGVGPRHGLVLLAKAVDQAFIELLMTSSALTAELLPAADDAPSTAVGTSTELVRVGQVRLVNEQSLSSDLTLLNSIGQPIYRLVLKRSRVEYQQAQTMLNRLTAILFGLGMALGAVISWLIIRNYRHRQTLQDSQVALQQSNLELEKLANLDGLTHVANRRSFDQYLRQEWARALRNQTPLTLVLCDIDHFKSYNDSYGHLAGDACLIQIAAELKHSLKRPCDFVARYGGEEFAIVLPETALVGGLVVAKNLCARIEALKIEHYATPAGCYLTVSVGVACMTPQVNFSEADLIAQSDQHLYLAKKAGRNQVSV